MHITTIVARNYLAAARVLARSFCAANPGGTCWTLVIDDVDGECDGDGEPFELIRPQQLGIAMWDQMTAGYSVLELSTAVKPWLLQFLLARPGIDRVTYLDPDIQVFDSLREVDDLLGEHAVVVNPHLTAPMPRDGRRPAETDILQSGSFNLGFAGFAAGEQTSSLLEWWAQRLATDCLVAPERGYFVDQRWMDLAPGLIPSLHVLRDPGYNVAYWNLSNRQVQRNGDGYVVNGRPLRFFHFSGYDPARPAQLSKHQDRISLEAEPVLRELCDGYARALAAEGHGRSAKHAYGWATLPDGTPLDGAARAVFRDAAAAGELSGQSIFTAAGASEFEAVLSAPAARGGQHGVSRYLASVRNTRPDLRDAFPDLDGADGGRMAAWAQLIAASTGEVPASLLAAQPGAGGVDVAGYFQGVMGVGEHARQLAAALETQGIPITTTMLHPEAAPEDETLAGRPAATAAPMTSEPYFNLLCANAEGVPMVAAQLGEHYFAGRYTIGFWAWEVSAFPDRYFPAFGYLDEVWVGSRHVRDAIADVATVPVLAIPQPVSLAPDFAAAAPPPGLPDGFKFLFAFDYLSVFERKNPLGTIDAFKRAFAPGSGAVLIVKTLNDDYDPECHRRLQAAAASHPDVHLLTRRLSATERDGLTNTVNCYVSLHRAEGFGYTLAESMWAGKPVVATRYSGNLDYMTDANSYLVDQRLIPIGPGHDPYPATGVWADADIDHAAKLMREVFEHREQADARGARAAADIRASHGPEASGAFMARRLERLLASPGWRPARGRPHSGPLSTEWIDELIREGPVAPARPRFGGAQRAARKSLLRLLKPLAAHERTVDSELLKSIEKVDANVRSLASAYEIALRRIEELSRELDELRGERER